MKTLIVIPARFGSTRFPGKPLALVEGIPMVIRVWQQCCKSTKAGDIVIATDHADIFSVAEQFGAPVVMTRSDHPSGTDRVIEVMQQLGNYDAYLNVQGDEPYIHPELIDSILTEMEQRQADVVTAVSEIHSVEDLASPHIVKAVRAQSGYALYFSRHPLPYVVDVKAEGILASAQFYRHAGIYGFRKSSLELISGMGVSALERAESLEQLRWLENGLSIYAVITEHISRGIDTPEQLEG
jgi:3-deoxy-manno-octulosonate cytidylyltransferase (CMP-KDO synthetase)